MSLDDSFRVLFVVRISGGGVTLRRLPFLRSAGSTTACITGPSSPSARASAIRFFASKESHLPSPCAMAFTSLVALGTEDWFTSVVDVDAFGVASIVVFGGESTRPKLVIEAKHGSINRHFTILNRFQFYHAHTGVGLHWSRGQNFPKHIEPIDCHGARGVWRR